MGEVQDNRPCAAMQPKTSGLKDYQLKGCIENGNSKNDSTGRSKAFIDATYKKEYGRYWE
jgi:hypothetical protein